MNKLLLATSALVLAALPAMAADITMPMYKAPPPMGFNWAGGYLGLHLGGAWAKTDFGDIQNNGVLPLLNGTNGTMSASGIAGGGQIGWNWLLPFPNWLVGVEVDVSGTDLHATGTTTPTPGGGTVGWTDKTDAFGTMRMRAGYVMNNWMIYGTGGLGWAHDKLTRTQQVAGVNSPVAGFIITEPPNPTGWVAGGGVEWGFARNWTAKVEYLHFDMTSSNSVNPALTINQTHVIADTVRVGVNYLFN
jgi:outer membrane immunogenic protein